MKEIAAVVKVASMVPGSICQLCDRSVPNDHPYPPGVSIHSIFSRKYLHINSLRIPYIG